MKPPVIRVVNPNRRAVFRLVVQKLRTLEARMVALRITPEIEELIQPHHGGYVYLQERLLYRNQLQNFRALQSRCLEPYVTPHTITLEKTVIRVGPGQMGEYHARVAVRLALMEMQAEVKVGPQTDLAHRIVEYWRWVRKLKPKQYREHFKHAIRR